MGGGGGGAGTGREGVWKKLGGWGLNIFFGAERPTKISVVHDMLKTD